MTADTDTTVVFDTTAANAPKPAYSKSALARMAEVRRLVRKQGMTPDDAARATGVDPIIAQLWLRLPDNLWPVPSAAVAANAPAASSPTTLSPAPKNGLHHVLTCRILAPAFDRLCKSDSPMIEAAVAALEKGIKLPRPEVAPGSRRFARKPLAVPVPAATFPAVATLASDAFNGDLREAAGWLIARGTGMVLPLPTADELNPPPKPPTTNYPPVEPKQVATPQFVVAPHRRPQPPATPPLPKPPAPLSNETLRKRRKATGLSQRDLARTSGIDRGTISEVERGRRRTPETLERISRAIDRVEAQQLAR